MRRRKARPRRSWSVLSSKSSVARNETNEAIPPPLPLVILLLPKKSRDASANDTNAPGDVDTEAFDAAGELVGQVYKLRRDYTVVMEMTIAASGYSWWVAQSPSN